jgi:hypothetical protein
MSPPNRLRGLSDMRFSTSIEKQIWIFIVAVGATISVVSADDYDNRKPLLGNTSQHACAPSWNAVVWQSSSPADVCKAVKARVKYVPDVFPEDEWRGGQDTWDKGEGDCEDYAAAVKDLCAEKGFKSDIYVFRSRTARAAHAVTIGEIEGTMWFSSNGSYEEVKSMDAVKEKLCSDLGWWEPDVKIEMVEKTNTQTASGQMEGDPINGVKTMPRKSRIEVVQTMPDKPARNSSCLIENVFRHEDRQIMPASPINPWTAPIQHKKSTMRQPRSFEP